MDLTFQSTALGLFWGTFVANFVWVNRHAVINKTKTCVSDIARYVVMKSKKVFRGAAKVRHGQKDRINHEQKAQESYIGQSQVNVENKPVQKSDETTTKQKRVSKPIKKQRNLRKLTQNYEECILRRAYVKKLEQKESNEFRQHLRHIEERKWSEEIVLAKKESAQNFQDIEKFVQDQLDIEEDVSFILPYDPFEPTDQDKNQGEAAESVL